MKYETEKKARIPSGLCRKCGQRNTEAGFSQCEYCRNAQARSMKEWRHKNLEKDRQYQREWKTNRRKKVLAHYGGACACCKESTFEFLAVDHINGGGDAHRREVGGGGPKLVDWLIAHSFPTGFQILCHNCNQAKGFYGQCPHEVKA